MVATNVGRNDPCPCGSGQKYKKCCLTKVEDARRATARETAHSHAHECHDPTHDHGSHPDEELEAEHVHDEHCDHHFDDDDAPLDPIWEALVDQPLERRCELTLERVQGDAPLDPDTCIDLINSIGIELLQERRSRELERVLDAARRSRPEVIDEYGTFDRALRAWIALQDDGPDTALLDMAEHSADDPEELLQLLDAYLYHDRSAAVSEAARVALSNERLDEAERPEILDELRDVVVQTSIIETLTANPDLASAPPDLLERLRRIGEVDLDVLDELVARRTGRSTEALTIDEIRGVRAVDEAEQVIFLLSLEFCGVLTREHGFSRTRAELARAETAAYLTERLFDTAKPDGRAVKQALRGVPKRAGYLIPDAPSVRTHLELSADPVFGSVHRATAMLTALPAWFEFLRARGLGEAAEGTEVLARIRSSSGDLPELAESFCEDPDVLRDLRMALAA